MSEARSARGTPLLAGLVQAGAGQTEAVALGHGIFMVRDISNAYLVTTGDGDVLVNSGFMLTGAKTEALLDPCRTGSLRYILLTQAHPDHYGGVPALREPATTVVAQARFADSLAYYDGLHEFTARRSGKLWSFNRPDAGTPPRPPLVVPDVTFEDGFAVEVGGRRFEMIATPGGETLCSACVWMPDDRIVFTGNLFGPVFLGVPNLVTVRGDRPRLVDRWLASLERVRDLSPALLVTGHGDPIEGVERIRSDLDRMHAAMSHVRDRTIAGMNEGRTVHELMRDIRLAGALALGEYHGKVAWAVRAIWEENAGWFHYDSTTSLYEVPRSSVDVDLAALAGGADALAARALARLEAGEPLEAMHLLDVALGAEPGARMALDVKKAALEALLARSGGVNLSETMWLRSEIAGVEARLGATA